MSEGMNDPHEEALGELALARIALHDRDLHHAAQHVAEAISHEPALPEAHELLAVLRAEGGGPELYPLDERPTVGEVVAHAHLLAAAGSVLPALSLLAQATAFSPAKPWADVPWISRLTAAELDPDMLVREVVVKIIPALGAPAAEAVRNATAPWLALLRQAISWYPDHPLLHSAASGIARRLGETALALSWAEKGVELESTKLTEVWWGNALRAAGRHEEAVEALRRAEGHDPADLSIASDLAQWLTEMGRADEGLQVIDNAIAADPSFDCVVYTAHRLRFEATGDPDHLVALADFERVHSHEVTHEHDDLWTASSEVPWLGFVPLGTESSVGLLSDSQVEPLSVVVFAMEPPSALWTVRSLWPNASVECDEVGEPDPRLPLRPGVQLWSFDGTKPLPLPGRPSEQTAQRVAELVEAGWAPPPVAYDWAVGLSGVPVEELLSQLVHPTRLPQAADLPPSAWQRATQAWCCLGLLHHLAEEPWPASTRRKLLLELAFGVEDWITEAAVYALVTAAWVDPACRPDVAAQVTELFEALRRAARTRPVTILESLAQLVFLTPGMPRRLREQARELCGQDVWPRNRPYRAAILPMQRKPSSWVSKIFRDKES